MKSTVNSGAVQAPRAPGPKPKVSAEFLPNNNELTRLPLGERLIRAGNTTRDQVTLTLRQQQQLRAAGREVRLGELLVRNRFVTQDAINEILSERGSEMMDSSRLRQLIPAADAARLGVVPVAVDDGVLVLKICKPLTQAQRADIMRLCAIPVRDVRVQLVDRHEIHRSRITQESAESLDSMLTRLRTSDQNPQMLRAVIETLLHDAIDRRASDIHIDLKPDPDAWISYRIDSVIQQLFLLPDRVMAALISRLKTLSGMDASNMRTAQDGRMQIDHRGRMVGFRLAAQPVIDGETMTIRVIDAATLPTAEYLFQNQPKMLSLMNRIARVEGKTGGLVLVTGPTGSGKSTTLYTMASRFPRDSKNIITVEDPVEYVIPFVRQIQIQQLLDQKATEIERSVLRQDPDVLIFGEIRDTDSAKAALKFAESGHLVLATLHSKSAAGALERLLSIMGSEDRAEAAFVLTTTILAVINQGLLRRLCDCAVWEDRAEAAPEKRTGKAANADQGLYLGKLVRRAVGCDKCMKTGYRGRVAVHETLVFELDDAGRTLVASEVAATGNINQLLAHKQVRLITREEVANQLLDAGLIDEASARTTFLSMAGAVGSSPEAKEAQRQKAQKAITARPAADSATGSVLNGSALRGGVA